MAAEPWVVEVRGPCTPAQARGLGERLAALLDADRTRRVVCELHGTVDLGVLDALARLRLVTRRYGTDLTVRSAGAALVGLLALTGLDAVLSELLVSEPVGQAEPGEQGGVEEVVDVGDPPV